MIKAGIVGGTGYTGVELLRLLVLHPNVDVHVVTSRAEKGLRVDATYPSLRGFIDVSFVEPTIENLKECNVVFFATPNATAMHMARKLLSLGIKIIDLSADFRLKDVAEWEHWYGAKHVCPELIEKAVYGLPEMNRAEIKNADLVANPGCYPTASLLALLPFIPYIDENAPIFIDAKSGVSGAGKKLSESTHFCNVNENIFAYNE